MAGLTASGSGGYPTRLKSFALAFIADLRLRSRLITGHPLFKITLLGLGIRLVLAPLTQFTYDPVVWYSAGNDMLAGLSPYYAKTYSYPPLWAYTYFPFLLLASLLVDPRTFGTHIAQMDWISLVVGYSPTILSPVFLFAVKLPLIIADVVTGILLYKLVQGFSGYGNARKTYLFWIFNPLVIWTSAVHGAFDVIPAMFTVLALTFALRAKYLPAGISLSIAALYKLYPVYLIPFYAILVWTNLGRELPLTAGLYRKARRLLAFIVGGAIPVLVSIPFVSIGDILHTVIVRQAYLSSMGGISLWMISYAPGFGWMWGAVAGNMNLIMIVTGSIALAISAFTGWTLVRGGGIELSRLWRSQVIGISAIYLTLVTVNPQYIVWILPFLTLAVSGANLYRKRTILLTFFALGWQLTISGPLILLPMSYLGLPAQSLTAPVLSILVSSASLFNPFIFFFGLGGGLILISFLIRKETLSATFRLRIPSAQSVLAVGWANKLMRFARSSPSYFLIAFMIFLYASSTLFLQTSTTGRFVPTSVDSKITGNTLTTRGSFMIDTGKLPLQLSLVAAPVMALGQDRPVFIYYDTNFPTLGNDQRGWIGITDHLPAALGLRGYSGRIQIVNATGLRNVLTQNFTSVVVIPSGVLPSTVQNATNGLVDNWLRSGGLMAWMGGPFGFYSNPSANPALNPYTTNMSIAIQPQTSILGYRLTSLPVNGTGRIATVPTSFSSALNLTYSDVWFAPALGLLKSVGGVAVGHVQNSSDTARSSISIVPVGLGRVIIFGGPVSNVLTADGEDVVSHDLSQILALGNVSPFAGIGYTSYVLPAQTVARINFVASFNVTSIQVTGIVLEAFSDYSFSNLYWREAVPIVS